MGPGLVVYTSCRLETLLHALADHLAAAPLPPLRQETIVVPSQGLARWTKQRLAERFGIAASLELPFPGAFVQQLEERLATGPLRAIQRAFHKDVLPFRLWRLLDEPALKKTIAKAAAYVQHDPDQRKRLQLVTRLANLFDDYQLYRPDLLERWAAGDDDVELGPHAPWQAELWRALLRDAGVPLAAAATPPAPQKRGRRRAEPTGPLLFGGGAATSPPLGVAPTDVPADAAHRFPRLLRALRDPAQARLLLPPRLAVFGAGTLPPAVLELLAVCAEHVPVALYVPMPTGEFSEDVHRRSTEHNALFARFGAEAREFAKLLTDKLEAFGTSPDHLGDDLHEAGLDDVRRDDDSLDTDRDDAAGAAHAAHAPSLLAQLQQDVAALLQRGEGRGPDAEPIVLRRDDSSLRVHSCHGPQRELEVVRDQILDAFDRDPTLQPHDVLVLVPDIERYAPFAHAVFGPVVEFLPFHVADKSPASDLPLCASLFAVLDLAHERLEVHEVLHLLENPAVQARFQLRHGDLPALRARCERAGIRWGRDGAQRALQFQVPAFEENSWAAGIERLLFGVATGPVDDLVNGVLPVADATSGRDESLNRLLHFLQTLFAQLSGLQQPQPLAQWATRLEELLAALFVPQDADDERALALLRATCADLRRIADASRLREPLQRVVVQSWLASALQRHKSQRGFLAGAVTVAALMPMRTVPVRQLYVCGLDDASFPRRDRPVPFDLMAAKRRPGDRSVRLDDRQMFLDVLMAARERLHLTYVGRSQKDDSECAPSVVLAELLDFLDAVCTTGATTTQKGKVRPVQAREWLTVAHPLQPWSVRYRDRSDDRLFTFGLGDQQPLPPLDAEPAWCTSPVTPPPELLGDELPLARLLDFWWNPSRFFLREVAKVRVRDRDDEAPEHEPFVVEPLDRWRLQDEKITRAMTATAAPRDPEAHMRATGLLPIGGRGSLTFHDVELEAETFLAKVRDYGRPELRTIDVMVQGVRVFGEIPGVTAKAIVYGRLARTKSKYRLRAFLFHVFGALQRAADPARPWPERTVVLTKDKLVTLAPLAPAEAAEFAHMLIMGYREGLAQPLPVFEDASETFAKTLAAQREKVDEDRAQRVAARAAKTAFEPDLTGEFPTGDSIDPDVALCWRGRDPIGDARFIGWASTLWGQLRGLETP